MKKDAKDSVEEWLNPFKDYHSFQKLLCGAGIRRNNDGDIASFRESLHYLVLWAKENGFVISVLPQYPVLYQEKEGGFDIIYNDMKTKWIVQFISSKSKPDTSQLASIYAGANNIFCS